MTDTASRLASLHEMVQALAELAADDNRHTAQELAGRLIAALDDVAGHAPPAAASQERAAIFRTNDVDRFRTDAAVESCPRCTLRSFRPQRHSADDEGVLYACSSCGYQARLELSQGPN
jgi:hypothetical protein